jgi:hypothetical protein
MTPNWPEGHALKAVVLIAEALTDLSDFCFQKVIGTP